MPELRRRRLTVWLCCQQQREWDFLVCLLSSQQPASCCLCFGLLLGGDAELMGEQVVSVAAGVWSEVW